MAILASLGKYRNTGLFLMRLGLGVMFMLHGYPKLLGGPETWTNVGGAMKYLGITFVPAAWGLAAAAIETFGGFLILIGLAFRPVCLFLLFTMIVAATMHLQTSTNYMDASHAIEVGFVFLELAFIGPGKYSDSAWLCKTVRRIGVLNNVPLSITEKQLTVLLPEQQMEEVKRFLAYANLIPNHFHTARVRSFLSVLKATQQIVYKPSVYPNFNIHLFKAAHNEAYITEMLKKKMEGVNPDTLA